MSLPAIAGSAADAACDAVAAPAAREELAVIVTFCAGIGAFSLANVGTSRLRIAEKECGLPAARHAWQVAVERGVVGDVLAEAEWQSCGMSSEVR